MGRLFGTDGIRGIFGQEPITPEMGFKVGRAAVRHCLQEERSPNIIVGRDTRFSGEVLERAIVSGVLSEGGKSLLVGVLPTPGVAFITREVGAGAGIVISASHNSYEYNGFKIFSNRGYKFSQKEESAIEELISSDMGSLSDGGDLDEGQYLNDAGEGYVSFLKTTLTGEQTFEGMKIVLDCANGATHAVAPVLFRGLGTEVESLFDKPDGKNINQGCGSQYPQILSSRVVETGADAGLAFDGDGDRLIAVDEKGEALTGDQILIICAKMLKDRGDLKNSLVVSTVMSNLGFRIALKELGLAHLATKVGDRFVLEGMRAKGAVLGGEDSGHILFLKHHTTGDGLLTALQLLSAMKIFKLPLSFLSTLMTRFPQSLLNVPVKRKPEISSVPELAAIMEKVERELGEKGRVLVRYSGTEPVCRIMIEGEKKQEIDSYANLVAEVVRKSLNDS
ncbi:MAG: phosphoglucosamine mutase [Pseudomonadota bacterium]